MVDPPIVFCVCVPARNEAARLPVLLAALAAQDWPDPIMVAIGVNNTTDDSLSVIADAQRHHGDHLDIKTVVADFAPELAHAGSARKLAMDAGLARVAMAANGMLVSTDADSRPPPDWLRNMAVAFNRGADLVGGRIAIDEQEPLPQPVHALRVAWDAYWTAVRAIEDEIDPLPWDPAPRHGDHTGASLAIRADIYRMCGGVPLLASGEDGALVRAAVAMGARLAHPADVHIAVSPRLDGRAEGGMAIAMRQLYKVAEEGGRPMAPAFDHWRERALWRRRLRARADGHALIARREPLLPPMPHDMVLEISA